MNKLEQLKAAYEAATPGEWGVGGHGNNMLYGSGEFITEFPVYGCHPKEAVPNATFIALAHNAMPQLLEAVELLKKLHDECDGDALGTLKAPTWTTACQVATCLHNLKFPNAVPPLLP